MILKKCIIHRHTLKINFGWISQLMPEIPCLESGFGIEYTGYILPINI